MRFASVPAVAAFLALAACGTSVHHVRGPDGEVAHVIRCHYAEDCYKEAAKLCLPGGYLIRTNGGNVNGALFRGSGHISSTQDIVVSCRDDLPEEPEAAPREPTAAEEAKATCEEAFGRASELAVYWARMSPGAKLLDEPPARRDFVAVCKDMPENVRRCLSSKHRDAHVDSCDAVLTRLDADHRAKIDGLFLQARPVEAAARKTDADAGSTM
jgi:hypothetical protein